jgi:DNA-binding beta-propeller fold protein YncE
MYHRTPILALLLTPLALAAPCDPLPETIPLPQDALAINTLLEGRTLLLPDYTGAYVLNLDTQQYTRIPAEPFPTIIRPKAALANAQAFFASRTTNRVYAVDTTTGAITQTFEPTNPEDPDFGLTLAADDRTLAITARNAVYVYDLPSGNLLWRAEDDRDAFGWGTAVTETKVIVANPWLQPDNGPPVAHRGAIHIYDRATAQLERTIFLPQEVPTEDGGANIAADNTVIAVAGDGANAVAIYDTNTGELIRTWTLPANQLIGRDIAVTNARTIIATSHSTFVLDEHARVLTRFAKPFGHTFDTFGASIAAENDTLVITDLPNPVNPSGGHYTVSLTGLVRCEGADLAEPFGQLTFADLGAYFHAYVNERPEADLAPPCGRWNIRDLSAFAEAWQDQCFAPTPNP